MTPADLALVAEATRRSGLVWLDTVETPEQGGARPVWHVWHDGAAYVVTGGREQPLPGLAGRQVVVVVRSRARQADRVVQWVADVERVEPGTPAWDEVVPLLHAARLNAADGEQQPLRWARESTVLRLTPTGELRPVHGEQAG